METETRTFRRSSASSAHLYTMSRISAKNPAPYTFLAVVLGDKNPAQNFSSVSQVIPKRKKRSGAMQRPKAKAAMLWPRLE